jgi:hypothetical protein
MSKAKHAAELVETIDRLTEQLHVNRRLPNLSIQDNDKLTELHEEVVRLAMLAGLDAPPPLVDLKVIGTGLGELKFQSSQDADKWEQALQALRNTAREAEGETLS